MRNLDNNEPTRTREEEEEQELKQALEMSRQVNSSLSYNRGLTDIACDRLDALCLLLSAGSLVVFHQSQILKTVRV